MIATALLLQFLASAVPPEIANLTEFLASTLPQALVAKSSVLIGVIVSVVSLLLKAPVASARRKWLAPLLALLLGQIAGWTVVGFADGQWLLGAALGAFIGLSAIGVHSGGKNGTEAIKAKRTRRKAA